MPVTPDPTEDILDLQPAHEKEPLVEPSQTQTFKTEEAREPHSFLDRDVEQQTKSLLAQLDQEVQRKQRQNFEESYFALERVLRPILKEWCNQHLPEIVARSVQKEIKQLVRTLTQRDYG